MWTEKSKKKMSQNMLSRTPEQIESWKQKRQATIQSRYGGSNWVNRPEVKQKISDSKKKNPTKYWLGKKRPDISGEKHYAWVNNPRLEDHRIRNSIELRNWRKQVFERDDYTCQACGIRGGKLNADHELPWAFFPDLRFEVLNGRALCIPCHRKTPTWGAKIRKQMEYYNH